MDKFQVKVDFVEHIVLNLICELIFLPVNFVQDKVWTLKRFLGQIYTI